MDRRELSKALIASAAGAALQPHGADAAAQSHAAHDGPVFSTTQAEIKAGVTPVDTAHAPIPIDLLRYGIVPNEAGAATANTKTLRALLDPAKTGPIGRLIFPPVTGADTYHFNGAIAVRDGIDIDLMGCTLSYTGIAGASDTNSGLFVVRRDFSLKNGTINVAVDTSVVPGAGHALFIGGRGTDSSYFTIWDSLEPKPLGNITLSNLRINIKNTGTKLASTGGIEMLGGIQNLMAENIVIDLNGSAPYGIAYEFGWATNERTAKDRHTSHAHNMRFENIVVLNVGNQDGGYGAGIHLGGCYNSIVDGLKVVGAPTVLTYTPGEAMFYRPWPGVDDLRTRLMTFRRIVGIGIRSNGIGLIGAQKASGGYLSSTIAALGHPADYAAQTDLMSFLLESFVVDAAGSGLNVSGPITARHGRLTGSATSGQLILTDECTDFSFEDVWLLNSRGVGLRANFGSGIWSPPRQKCGMFNGGKVAGNTGPGFAIGNCESFHVRGTRIGYEKAHDGIAESTQTYGIQADPTAKGVVADGCHVMTARGGEAYRITGEGTRGCSVMLPRGTVSFSGVWELGAVGQATAAQVADKASFVNTANKYYGRQCWDRTNNRLMVALGSANVDPWKAADGSASIIPS